MPGTAGGGTVPPEWEERIRKALSTVTDPCCRDVGLSVVDMGLVDRIARTGDGVEVHVVLTTGWCPFTAYLFEEMREAVERALPEAGRVEVRVDWGKAWSSDRLSPRAAAELLFLPSPKEVRGGSPAPSADERRPFR
ncbi:MAG: iron-sulfur cluster assembly protein [Symbiobacteriaceae bacterium]